MAGLFDLSPNPPSDLARWADGLNRALEYAGSTHNLQDLYLLIRKGEAQLWGKGDSCVVTEIKQYPRKRVLNIWLATGERDECYALAEWVVDWATQLGCDLVTFTGRRGWERANLPDGWEPKLTYFERRIR